MDEIVETRKAADKAAAEGGGAKATSFSQLGFESPAKKKPINENNEIVSKRSHSNHSDAAETNDVHISINDEEKPTIMKKQTSLAKSTEEGEENLVYPPDSPPESSPDDSNVSPQNPPAVGKSTANDDSEDESP